MPVSVFNVYVSALSRMGLDMDDGQFGTSNPSSVLPLLASAYGDFSADENWSFLYTESTFNTVAGTNIYTVPEDWQRTSFLGIGMDLLEQRQVQDLVARRPLTGTPRYYNTDGDRLLLAPTPSESAAVTHGYYKVLFTQDDWVWTPGWGTFLEFLQGLNLGVPDLFISILSLYVAKTFAVASKDRTMTELLRGEIAECKARIMDNGRRVTQPGRIKTRQDW